MTIASRASTHRPWVIFATLAGLALLALFAPLALRAEATTSTTTTSTSTSDAGTSEPGEIISSAQAPDVVVTLPAGLSADETAAFVRILERNAAIAWAAEDQIDPAAPRILVAFAGSDAAGLRAIDAVAEARLDGAGYSLSGRLVADDEIADRIGLAHFLVVVIAGLGAAVLVAWLSRLAEGAVAGVTVALSAWLGGVLGGSAAGSFDGSVATTRLPAALAAVIVSGYLLYRLLLWFDDPIGDDQADMIRRSILSVAVELVLFFSGLFVVVGFAEVIGPSRSVVTVAFVGAAIGALLTLAIVPPLLAALGGTSPWFPLPIPTGRDLPVLALVGVVAVLTLLGLSALRTTAPGGLLDERALGDDPSVAATRNLLETGGDPTSGIVATFAPGTDQQAKMDWLERVSALPSVASGGRIDTPINRYRDGVATPIVGLVGADADTEIDEAPSWALIALGVTGRSGAAVELVGAIEQESVAVDVELAGVPVTAKAAESRDRSTIWLTIFAFTVASAVLAYALISDLALAGLVAAIRFVGLAAVAGIYRLLVSSASGAEILLAVVLVAIGMGLFELGYLRRLLATPRADDSDLVIGDALAVEGSAGAIGLGLAAFAGLGMLVVDLAVLRRLGLVLAVAVIIKVVAGMWVLRPALLGGRAITHFAAQPVRAALRALNGERVSSQAEHQAWIDVVAGLLWSEFTFQADPTTADISEVFVADTPLYHKSADHHANLADAGLRIVGRHPQLRGLRVIDNAAPATVAVTVDHPLRHLVDGGGKIVGVRRAERRSVMLWLNLGADGTYRIVDSVELGTVPLTPVVEPEPVPSPVPAVSE